MNRKRQFPTSIKLLALLLVTALFAGFVSGCSITDLISKSTDIIDHLAGTPTDASTPEGTPDIPGLPGFLRGPTVPNQTSPTDTSPTAATTVPDVTEPTAPEFVIDPSNIRYGIVLNEYIKLFEGPSQTYQQSGSLKYGDRVQVYGTDKGWVYTIAGWSKAENFYLEGDKGEYAVGSSTVTGSDVNLRTGPDTDYEVLKRHNTGDQLHILEEFLFDKLWWGYTGQGWICMDYVYVNGSMSDNYGVGIITGDVVNVRSGPGTGYERTGSVKQGEQVEVYNFFTVKNVRWACTNRGWICMDYMRYTPAT